MGKLLFEDNAEVLGPLTLDKQLEYIHEPTPTGAKVDETLSLTARRPNLELASGSSVNEWSALKPAADRRPKGPRLAEPGDKLVRKSIRIAMRRWLYVRHRLAAA
jgi:hypothetical protein